MASCHTHAALPGGAAVSAATTRAIVHQHCNPPTEFTEFTEASGVEEPPTDFTDAHRWLGCVGFSHGIHRSFWRRRASHGFHGCPQIRRVWHPCHTHAAHQTIFPQKPQNLTQPKNLWASVKSVGEYFRQSFLWVLRILWEDLTQPNHLWASVKSVGEYSPTVVSVKSVNSVGEPYAA